MMSRGAVLVCGAVFAFLDGLIGGVLGAALLVLVCFAGGLVLAQVTTSGNWRRDTRSAMGPIAVFTLVAVVCFVAGTLVGAA